MRTRSHRLSNTSSMLTLAAFVLGGAVVTTLVQAQEMDSAHAAPPGYVKAGLYQDQVVQPSQHRWLRPANLQGRAESGAYRVYFQQADNGAESRAAEPSQARVSFNVGDLRGGRDQHSRSLMSDWERDQYRRNGAWFSMSVGRQW